MDKSRLAGQNKRTVIAVDPVIIREDAEGFTEIEGRPTLPRRDNTRDDYGNFPRLISVRDGARRTEYVISPLENVSDPKTSRRKRAYRIPNVGDSFP